MTNNNTWMARCDIPVDTEIRIFVKMPHHLPNTGCRRVHSVEAGRELIDSVVTGPYGKNEILVNGKVVATKTGAGWL